MAVYGSARQQLRRRRLFGEAVVTHAGQTRHIITNNQQPTTTKMPTMNRHSFYGASSECRQLNLDARLRKAGRNARYRPFALDNLQGPPETNGGTNAPPVPLFREVPGQSRRLAFPCLQYTHMQYAGRRKSSCGPIQYQYWLGVGS
jgi:hypothetical protein